MRSSVMIAMGDFWQWLEEELSRRSLARELQDLMSSVNRPDGFEIPVTGDSLLLWASELEKGQPSLPERFDFLPLSLKHSIQQCCANTVHLPHPAQLLNLETSHLRDSLQILQEGFGIHEGTVHPDGSSFQDFEDLQMLLPDSFRLSVENMDIRKVNFRTLNELGDLLDQFPGLVWTFDLCHWLEHKRPLLCSEVLCAFEKYGSRLSKIHFSVPSSTAQFYRLEDEDDLHYLYNQSGWTLEPFLANLRHAVAWVIEGTVPHGRFESIQGEISFLKHVLGDIDKRNAA